MIEFALITPLLLLCIFGMIDLGRLFLVQAMVTNGAREGARMVALRQPAADVTARANASMPGLDALSTGTHSVNTVAACPAAPTPAQGGRVTVSVTGFKWLALGGIAGLFPGGGIPVPSPAATSEMRCLG
ncbi:TadE/TadG family type IV pilus assembly protein [Knoellia sp. CPCC 206450]|uniref:TadE/TadG family type IV pilus assembly protein n=1 Tax=Knoellia tibetensis TaxID=3404798 RepID=UPI003B42EA38